MTRLAAALASMALLTAVGCSFAPSALQPSAAANDATVGVDAPPIGPDFRDAAPPPDAGTQTSTHADAAIAMDDAGVEADAAPSLDDASAPDAAGGDAGPANRDASSALPYVPSNLDPRDVELVATAMPTISVPNGGVCSIDSTGTGAIQGDCGSSAPASFRTAHMRDGYDAMLVVLRSLDVADRGELRLAGDRVIIFLVQGNATIDGLVEAGGRGATMGPGQSRGCGLSAGAAGRNEQSGGGGGGGSYGTDGSPGRASGLGAARSPGGRAGTLPTPPIDPLRAGCPGGAGGDATAMLNGGSIGGLGGGGGGGVQISSGARLRVTGSRFRGGSIQAGGGGGGGGHSRGGGGGGGGAGGTIVLEAVDLEIGENTAVSVNGGAGAEGGSGVNYNGTTGNGGDGDDAQEGFDLAQTNAQVISGGDGAAGATIEAAATLGSEGSPAGNPSNDNTHGGGGGGGGGGLGRIKLRGIMCDLDPDAEVSGVIESTCPP